VTRQRVAFEARRMELDGLTVRIETLTDEQIEWNLLTKALVVTGCRRWKSTPPDRP